MQDWANRLYDWAVTSGIRIVAIILGAFILYYLIRTVTRRIIKVAGRKVSDSDLVSREQEMRARTLAGIVRGLIIGALVAIVALMVLNELGYNIGPLIAGAGIAGFAIGFGAQTLIKDIIGGFFILLEGQFNVGDVIETGSVKGKVEAIKLRTTLVRDSEGSLYIVPNGEMRVVSNLTKDWSRINVDVEIDYREDLQKVAEVLEDAARKTADSPAVKEYIMEGPQVLGVEELKGKNVRVRLVARTAPFRDPEVARVLRREIATALRENGIAMGEGE